MSSEKGDPNMRLTPVQSDGLTFHRAEQAPIVTTGYPWKAENGSYDRLPVSIYPQVGEGLAWVAAQPSGGMFRFRTDSRRLALKAWMSRAENSATCTPLLLSGFDVYLGSGRCKLYRGSLTPDRPVEYYEAALKGELPEGENELTLYAPLQNPFSRIEIGLDDGASLQTPVDFAVPKPVVFYGSSITCGFSASRPGLTYPARICRELDAHLINLGFGGQAKGEPIVAEKIAELEMGCFVLDYDHNAPSIEHLEATHAPFFRILREHRPELPIVIVSAPSYHIAPDFYGKRAGIVKATYEAARAAGDQRVWYVDGTQFFPKDGWADHTVDSLHPNDNGFKRMAEDVLPAVKSALSAG